MQTPGQDLWSPSYLLLSAVNLFAWLSYNMITPVLAEYSLSIGASLSLAGVIVGLFAMASLFSRPLSGMLSDRLNRKNLNLVFTGVMALSLLVYALVDVVWVLLVFRAVHGVAFGISSTASLAIVSDVVPESRLAEGINYYGLSQILAVALGPGLGVWMADRFGYRTCLLCGAFLVVAAAVAAALVPYPGHLRPPRKSAPRKPQYFERSVLPLSIVYCSYTIINGVVSAYLVALAAERGIAGASWHFTVNAVVLFLVRLLGGTRGNRGSLSRKLYFSAACFLASMLFVGFAHSLWPLLAAGALKAVGQGVGMPAVQTAALQSVPRDRRGVAGSTIYIGGDLGQTIGSVAGGYTAQQVGYGAMHILSAAPLLLASALYAVQSKRRRKDIQPE